MGDAGIGGRNGQLPNPDLKPESGIGSDFGVDMAITERATFGVRGFYNLTSDAIVDDVVSNTPSQTRSVNAGDARAYGLELVYDHYVSDRIHFFTNFTRTVSRISNPFDKDQEGAALSFVPGYLYDAGMDWNATGTCKLTPYLHAVGGYYDSTSKTL
jgi:iron complex outermembrane recepter protein